MQTSFTKFLDAKHSPQYETWLCNPGPHCNLCVHTGDVISSSSGRKHTIV